MHMFDNMPEGKEQQKKHSNSYAMESAVVVAVVYLIMFFLEIIKEQHIFFLAHYSQIYVIYYKNQ